MKRILFIFLFLTVGFNLFAVTEIFGTAKEYADNQVIFYKYEDQLTYKRDTFFVLNFDAEGNFSTFVENNQITYTFAEFGIYFAYFFIEPNKNYELIFPEYIEKGNKDIFNPFFEATKIHFGIKNMQKTDLNYLIMDFDYFYNKFIDLKMEKMVIDTAVNQEVRTFIKDINERYKDEKNEYFINYKRYKIAFLKNITTKKRFESDLVFNYLSKRKVEYDNPAYMALFNDIYNSYFDKMLRTDKGQALYAIINYGHSIKRLNAFLSQNKELQNTQLREMVILKGLFDCFKNRQISWLPLLLTLDSLCLSTKYEQHKLISQNIADEVLSMSRNSIAPNFELPDSNNSLYSLKEFRGKYIYLQFANTTSITSQQDLDLMKKLYDRFYGNIIFITILTDNDRIKAQKFITRHDLSWTFLFTADNAPILSEYKVDSYPTYFLIDAEGCLKMTPAPSPSENIEKYIFKYTKEK